MEENKRSGMSIRLIRTEQYTAEKGFTLVETMVVLVIIGIIALFVAPQILSFGPNIRAKAAARDLHTNLQQMKTEAITKNRDAVITFNPVNAAECPPAGPTAPRGKYTITIDGIAKDYDLEQNTAICPLGTLEGAHTDFSLSYKFTPQGLWSSAADKTQAGIFQIKNDQGRTYQVTVSIAGGISTAKL